MSEAAESSLPEDVRRYRRRMRGVATFFIVIGCIGFLGLLASFAAPQGQRHTYQTLGLGINVSLLLIGGVILWHGARLGAIVLLLTLFTMLIELLTLGAQQNLLGLIRTVLYMSLAAFALFSAHRYHQETDIYSQPLGGSALLRWSGLAISTPLLLFLGVGVFMITTGISDRVLRGSGMNAENYEWLNEKNFLLSNERVEFFYSDGLFSIDEGGAMLTNQYVATWWIDEEGDFVGYWFKLGEICRVEQIAEGSAIEDAYYKVHGDGDSNWATINLSTTNGVHEAFIRRLKTINRRKQHPFFKAACERGEKVDRKALALANGIQPGLVSGDLVTAQQRDWMKDKRYLLEGEQIEAFWSYGEYHIKEGGTLLTDAYFGGWYRSNGLREHVWIEHGELCDIGLRVEASEDELRPLYRAVYGEDEWYQFYLSPDQEENEALVKRIIALNSEAATEETRASCEKNTNTVKGDDA